MLWARYQNYLKQNNKVKAFGFSSALCGAGVVIFFAGLVGILTGLNETYEQFYILAGIVFMLLGGFGCVFFRSRAVIHSKVFLSTSMIGLVSFLAVMYLAFWLSGEFGSLDNVLLEVSSAFTVTNLSLIKDPQALGQGLLVLRSLTQWVAGFGAIVFFSILLPSFVGSQARDRLEQANVLRNFKAIFGVYLGATILLLFGYAVAGMSWFDALTHSWTTISTGGFSNYSDGLAHFNSGVQWVAAIGMFIGGFRLILFFRALRGQPGVLWRSIEVRVYVLVVAISTLLVVLGEGEGIRRSFFSVVSALSGTGFYLENWVGFSFGLQVLLLMLIATGTMSGTPAGGFGLTRAIEAMQYIYRELYIQIHPKAVFRIKMGKHIVGESELSQTQSFQFFYLGTLILGMFLLAQFGTDFYSAIGGAVTAFASMGPSVGDSFVSPETLAELPRPARGVLSGLMLIGRVSIFPIMIVIFEVWERIRRGTKFKLQSLKKHKVERI